KISIVIPVFNEEGILHAAVVDLVSRLSEVQQRDDSWTYEILLAENGSSDRTVAIGEELAAKFPEVQVHSLGAPNYGRALKQGILRARGDYVVCDEIDLCDVDFHARAIGLLEQGEVDLVVGSKV